jgi:hypothetical protein
MLIFLLSRGDGRGVGRREGGGLDGGFDGEGWVGVLELCIDMHDGW